MTIEPSPPDDDRNDDGRTADDLDATVAERLGLLAAVAPPDLWPAITAAAAAAPGGTGPVDGEPPGPPIPLPAANRWPHRRITGLAAAAVILAVAMGVGIVAATERGGQRVVTPAEEPTVLPPGLAIGPQLGSDGDVPIGAFAVVYQGGLVVVSPDGEVVGHYTGQVPATIYDPARRTVDRLIGAPDGCEIDAVLESGLRLFCHDEWGPTVEVSDASGERQVIASFPSPPAGSDPAARVVGHLTASFPRPGVERGRPLLLQMSAECETRLALIVESPIGTDANPRGGTIRQLDGASYWDQRWMPGESMALGWSADGTEAYVWRFNSPCAEPLDQPGIYAYRLDSSSRLLVPTTADVIDVALITGEPPTLGEGAITPLPTAGPTDGAAAATAATATGGPGPGWNEWAGPLLTGGAAGTVATTDSDLVVGFARQELGMAAPEVAVSSVDLDPSVWIVTEGDLSVKLQPSAGFGANPISPEQRASWTVVGASSFWVDGTDFLSASVNDDSGSWAATFLAPTHGATVSATYAVGGRDVAPGDLTALDSGSTAQLRFDLGAEPTESALLTIRWHDADGKLVGYQRTTIPPGRFAAG